jgi:hypothetical protein
MDRLRSAAEKVELDQAIAGIEVLRKRMQAARTPASLQVVAGLDAALDALGLSSAKVCPNGPQLPEDAGTRGSLARNFPSKIS